MIADLFFKAAQQHPNKTALVLDDAYYSYAELSHFVLLWSEYLQQWGIEPGEHLGLVLPNRLEFVILMLAVARIGGVLVPVSPALPLKQIQSIMQACAVKKVLSDQAYSHTHHVDVANEDPIELDGITWAWVETWQQRALQQVSLSTEAALVISDLMASYNTPVLVNIDAPYLLVTTSGSTGTPKPIILSQQIKVRRAMATMALYHLDEQDVILAATPLYHSLAFRLLLMPLISGGTSVLMSYFSIQNWYWLINRDQVTFTIAVASQIQSMLEHYNSGPDYQLSSLRSLVSSSAALDPTLKSRFLQQWAGQFHECYGTSETAIVTNLNLQQVPQYHQSVGAAIPNVEIKILNANNELAAVNEPGEIVCKTPLLFDGYYQQPELTQHSLWHGYFRTGDLGKIDQAGYLYYLGRKSELIISGGINIYPDDIERVIAAHPSVVEAAAFPYPDAHLGEVVAVALVMTSGDELSDRMLRHYCVDQLADFQQPRYYFRVEALPKNALSKVMKQQLIAQYQPSSSKE